MAAEFRVWVRRRRSRLCARCEGGADGEEEGVGRGPCRCQISGLRWNHHHGNRRREKRPSPTLSGPRNECLSLPRRVSIQTTSPRGRWTSAFASEGPRTLRAAGSCSSLRQRAEAALRPLVDTAPKFASAEALQTLPSVIIPKPFHLALFSPFPHPIHSIPATLPPRCSSNVYY